jgi:hypothetical protein
MAMVYYELLTCRPLEASLGITMQCNTSETADQVDNHTMNPHALS